MKEEILKQVIDHADDLIFIFDLEDRSEYEKIKLCRQLRNLENEAHKFAEDCCNFLDLTEEEHEKKTEEILSKVDELLNFKEKGIKVFLNGDPRGYALKIDYQQARGFDIIHDWGSYGIIAPNFKED